MIDSLSRSSRHALPLWRRAVSATRIHLQETLGYPAHLQRLLRAHPTAKRIALPAPSIGLGSVVWWNELGLDCHGPFLRPGELRGWHRAMDGHYESTRIVVPALAALGTSVRHHGVTVDISEIGGLYAAKNGPETEFSLFTSMDEWIARSSPEFIGDISEAGFQKNLAHREIRILHGGRDHLSRFSWGDRLYLANSGGGHHFAAARYIARRLGRRKSITSDLQVYGLDPGALHDLCEQFSIFATVDDGSPESNSFILEFHDAMSASGTPWFWCHAPRPCRDVIRVLLFPKDDSKARRDAAVFRAHGFLDLGHYLTRRIGQTQCISGRPERAAADAH